MTSETVPVTEEGRGVAQFFFEVGYGACFAEALVRNDMRPPFTISDALIERAWSIAGEAHDDPAEFDRYLAASRLSASPTDAVRALEEENARLREVPLVFYDSNDPARCAATLAHALERGHGRVSIVGWRQLIADLNAALATGEA